MTIKSKLWLTALFCFTLAACDNEATPTNDPLKVVEAKYRFTETWTHLVGNEGSTNGIFSLGENKLTVTESTAGFSYDNVYTLGGGVINYTSTTWSWAYLYAGNVKIGFVLFTIFDDEIFKRAFLGTMAVNFSNPSIDTSDVQTTNNGRAWFNEPL